MIIRMAKLDFTASRMKIVKVSKLCDTKKKGISMKGAWCFLYAIIDPQLIAVFLRKQK